MIRLSQLSLAFGLALTGASAHADTASASLYQRLFKPGVPEQVRSDALAFALASAWQARGCTVAPELAEVMAAGLARETEVGRFQRKLDVVADAGCGAGATPAAAATAPEATPSAVDLLVARVTDSTTGDRETPLAHAEFSAARASLERLKADIAEKPADAAADAPAKDPLKAKKDKLEADIQALERARDEMRQLLRDHESLSNPSMRIESGSQVLLLCDTKDARPLHLARCSNLVYQEAARRYQQIVESAKTAATLAEEVKDPRVGMLKALALDLQPRVEYAAALEASTRSANYGLYVGPSQVLQDDGKWKEGSEYLLRFNTEVFDSESTGYTLCLLRASWCRGYTDISYTSPGVLKKEVANPGAAPNVFNQEGNLRVRAGIISHSNPWFGMEYAIGLTSPVEDNNSFSRVEPMARVGAHFQTLYNDGVVGELSVGFAHDRSRTFLTDKGTTANPIFEDEFNRLYLEGTVLFPRAEILGGWRLAGRLSMDAPINGDSEAEVRASVLVYYPLSNWLDTFKPVQAKPEK